MRSNAFLRAAALLCLLACAAGNAAAADPAITTNRLLHEMTDLQGLSRWPDPEYTNRQASSYDRASKSPSENWFANGDNGQFIRTEEKDGRKEFVVMDAEGPGAVMRIWSANAMGTIRFYLNGEEQPVFEAKMQDLLSGKHPLFPEPFAGMRSLGWNLYYPIPYSKRLKITTDEGAPLNRLYYQINYRTYPAGTGVEDFSPAGVEAAARDAAAVGKLLSPEASPGESLEGSAARALLKGKTMRVLSSRKGPAEVTRLRVRAEASDMNAVLRALVLRARFDNEREISIEAPLGDFFGMSPGINPYRSLPFVVLEDGTMISRWVMPFERTAEIEIENLSDEDVMIAAEADVRELAQLGRDFMHFHARFQTAYGMETRPFRDLELLHARGRGVFAGVALAVANPVKGWWGEGDEKIYVDGEAFPSHFGTGTEDYFGYAWCSNRPFAHAYHAQPRCDGPGNFGFTSVNRFHIADPIPFTNDFRFDIEVWHSNDSVKVDFASVAYWYARPGAMSGFARLGKNDLALPKIEPLKLFKAAGAIEAEALKFKAVGGKAEVQDMGNFTGNWSGEAHVWFTQGKPGDRLELEFAAPAEGEYEVFANFTKAVDYGIAKISVNGETAAESMDFYNDGVVPTGEVALGARKLKAEGNTLALEVTGANEKAVKQYMLAVDYLLLKPKS